MLEDNNYNDSEKRRKEIISKLSMSKAFTITQQIKMADKMSREQAIDLLKDTLVSLAYHQETFTSMLKSSVI
jgi:hypothetical protein